MKRNMALVAIVVCACSVLGGIYYTDAEEAVLKIIDGRILIEPDFLARFEYAYDKDPEYFQNLGITRVPNHLGLNFQVKETKQIIVVETMGPDQYMIGLGIKDGKPQVKYLESIEANKLFDSLAFPDRFTRAQKKREITSRVFDLVGDPGS